MMLRSVRFLAIVAVSAFVAACVDFNVQCTPNVTNPSGLAGYLGGADGGQSVTLSLDKVTVRSGDSTMGQLLTEAYYHSYDKLITDSSKLPAIAVENAGSIRTECRDTLSTGEVLRGWLRQIVPFDDAEYVFPMTSAEIQGVFEHSVAGFPKAGSPSNQNPSGGFLQVYGMTLDVDCSKQAEVLNAAGAVQTPGQRVLKVHLKPRSDPNSITDLCVFDFTGGNPTNPCPATTWVVANDYLYGGGDSYVSFAAVQGDPTSAAQKLDDGVTNFTTAAAYWAATYPSAAEAFPAAPVTRYNFMNCSLP